MAAFLVGDQANGETRAVRSGSGGAGGAEE